MILLKIMVLEFMPIPNVLQCSVCSYQPGNQSMSLHLQCFCFLDTQNFALLQYFDLLGWWGFLILRWSSLHWFWRCWFSGQSFLLYLQDGWVFSCMPRCLCDSRAISSAKSRSSSISVMVQLILVRLFFMVFYDPVNASNSLYTILMLEIRLSGIP